MKKKNEKGLLISDQSQFHMQNILVNIYLCNMYVHRKLIPRSSIVVYAMTSSFWL